MNYNTKSKIEQLTKLESSQKAKEMVGAASLQTNDKQESQAQEGKARKKNFILSLDENLIKQVDEFLQEFGKSKESRSSFVQEGIKSYLEHRKQVLREELEAKLAKIKQD